MSIHHGKPCEISSGVKRERAGFFDSDQSCPWSPRIFCIRVAIGFFARCFSRVLRMFLNFLSHAPPPPRRISLFSVMISYTTLFDDTTILLNLLGCNPFITVLRIVLFRGFIACLIIAFSALFFSWCVIDQSEPHPFSMDVLTWLCSLRIGAHVLLFVSAFIILFVIDLARTIIIYS